MNAAEFFDHWNVVWRDLLRAVAMLKEEHLDFRPASDYPRTVRDILSHIADLEEGWIQYVVRRSLSAWPVPDADRPARLNDCKERLSRVHRSTMEYLATVPVDEFDRIVQVPGDGTPKLSRILWHVFGQEIHHRGELFLCLSLLGLERPDIDRPS